MRPFAFAISAVLLSAGLAHSQRFTTAPCPNFHDADSSWFSHQEHVCELRRTTLPVSDGRLGVSGINGSIEVVGEDRSDIALEARVTAEAGSKDEALGILREITIRTSSPDIHADGPRFTGESHRSWSVSYQLHVPRRLAQADLRSSNGPIRINDVEARVSANTSNGPIEMMHIGGDVTAISTNGGLHLADVGGAVHAQTTNGGVQISLAGDHWHGSGLSARSTNGGINVQASPHLAAHLVAATTNGGIHVGYPISQAGKITNHVDTDLNGGGPTVELQTTNGGVNLTPL